MRVASVKTKMPRHFGRRAVRGSRHLLVLLAAARADGRRASVLLFRQRAGAARAVQHLLRGGDHRRVDLTPPGRVLLEQARELLAHSQRVEAAIRGAPGADCSA